MGVEDLWQGWFSDGSLFFHFSNNDNVGFNNISFDARNIIFWVKLRHIPITCTKESKLDLIKSVHFLKIICKHFFKDIFLIKHFCKDIFLINEFCPSHTENISKKDYKTCTKIDTKLLWKILQIYLVLCWLSVYI